VAQRVEIFNTDPEVSVIGNQHIHELAEAQISFGHIGGISGLRDGIGHQNTPLIALPILKSHLRLWNTYSIAPPMVPNTLSTRLVCLAGRALVARSTANCFLT